MEEYKQLLSAFATFVKPYGFKRKGAHFIKDLPEMYLIVGFEKSRYSTSQESLFVLNIGVALKKVLDYKEVSFSSNLTNTYWNKRISRPGMADDRHILKVGDDVKPVLEILKAIFSNLVLPEFEKRSELQVFYDDSIFLMKNDPRFLFGVVESILTLTKLYFPERTEEMMAMVFEKAKDSNDRLFINEVLAELRKCSF